MKFFLLDGSGFLYRAYYAFPQMINSEGRNVNVAYGFLRMVIKLLQEKPDYFVITWDSPVKTHRHESYPEYKATRKKMEDDFKSQIPLVIDIVKDLNLPNIVCPGYEADDILASLISANKNQNIMLHLYSADKDLKQVLDENVVCIDPIRNIVTNAQSFNQEYGFSPKSIVDYLSLLGDSSDNIKGVPGIGEKKATDLIKTYGTIENIYENIDKIASDIKDKLNNGKDSAYQSKSLIILSIIDEVINKKIEEFVLNIDFTAWKDVLVKKYKFASLEKSIDELRKKYIQPQQTSLF